MLHRLKRTICNLSLLGSCSPNRPILFSYPTNNSLFVFCIRKLLLKGASLNFRKGRWEGGDGDEPVTTATGLRSTKDLAAAQDTIFGGELTMFRPDPVKNEPLEDPERDSHVTKKKAWESLKVHRVTTTAYPRDHVPEFQNAPRAKCIWRGRVDDGNCGWTLPD